jgi:circadian clock protein KaiB
VAKARRGDRPERPARHRLKLYITGQTPRSTRAIANLRRICGEALPDDHEIVVIDVLEQPHLAEQDRVLVTPTLIKEMPPPSRRVLGDLSDAEQVLWGLQILPPEAPATDRGGKR